MAALLLLLGNWFTGACHAALLAYMFQLYSSRRIYVDTTDAFRQLPQQKMQRGIILGAHLALFVLVVYRCVSRHIGCRNVQSRQQLSKPGCMCAGGAHALSAAAHTMGGSEQRSAQLQLTSPGWCQWCCVAQITTPPASMSAAHSSSSVPTQAVVHPLLPCALHRLIESALMTLLTPEGRAMTKVSGRLHHTGKTEALTELQLLPASEHHVSAQAAETASKGQKVQHSTA